MFCFVAIDFCWDHLLVESSGRIHPIESDKSLFYKSVITSVIYMACTLSQLPTIITSTRSYEGYANYEYDNYGNYSPFTPLRPQAQVFTTGPSWTSISSPISPVSGQSQPWWTNSAATNAVVYNANGYTVVGSAGIDASQPSNKPFQKTHKRGSSGDQNYMPNKREVSSRGHSKPKLHIIPRSRPKSPSSPELSSSSSSSSGSLSPTFSPLSVAAPVHSDYKGLARTESGLLYIPEGHIFKRGEIVMTRTTRRLMKTSAAGRLTARHPCLVLEATATHVRVLQMTSHVPLTEDQVRVVGAKLRHWLAREDCTHTDLYGRPGLVTSPPSDRAGYIWVGDEGEWVPIKQLKYLTGTKVDWSEIERLEAIIQYHGTL